MILHSLELINFRNHASSRFDFESIYTFFHGRNGAGKSNILEAIYFLAYAKSYRSNDATKLIRHGKESAEIHAVFTDDKNIEHQISAEIGKKKGSASIARK